MRKACYGCWRKAEREKELGRERESGRVEHRKEANLLLRHLVTVFLMPTAKTSLHCGIWGVGWGGGGGGWGEERERENKKAKSRYYGRTRIMQDRSGDRLSLLIARVSPFTRPEIPFTSLVHTDMHLRHNDMFNTL